MYKLFLCFRLLRRRRITYLPIAAVTLCSAMVLIVVSVMGGFLDNIRSRSHGLLGDMILDNGSFQGFHHYQKFIDRIKSKPELKVAEATPVLFTYGLLRIPVRGVQITRPVQVVGIRFDEKVNVTEFGEGLFYNKSFPNVLDLKHTRMPLVGFDLEKDRAVLPDEWQKALGRSGKPAPDRDHILQAGPTTADWAGLGLFELSMLVNEPGYADDQAPLPGIIVGLDVSEFFAIRDDQGKYDRHLPAGFKMILTLLPIPMSETGNVSVRALDAVTRSFRYADDSRSGVYEIDSRSVYVDFDTLQRFLQIDEAVDPETNETIPARCSQIQIDLDVDKDDRKQLAAIKEKITEEWKQFTDENQLFDRFMEIVEAQTWEETQAQFIAAVEKEKQLMIILFGIISLVAVVLVLCVFYMIVVEKTRDIGVVKSVGGSSGGVAAIFLAYGAAVGLVGSVIGLVLGYLFVININAIHDWIATQLGWQLWSRKVYTFDRIPEVVKGWDMGCIFMVAILAAILGAVIPAIRAARMHPVESLRYE